MDGKGLQVEWGMDADGMEWGGCGDGVDGGGV